MDVISFQCSKEEHETISQIVDRYIAIGVSNGVKRPGKLDLEMDICACHCNGNDLDLYALLAADDFNLSHDVGGIHANMNRDTGELLNCFSPRYSL